MNKTGTSPRRYPTIGALDYEIMLASFQLDIPRMFAALAMINATGLLLFALMVGLEKVLPGHWHERSKERETSRP